MSRNLPACPAQKLLQLLGQQHALTIIHTLGTTELGFNDLQKKSGVNTRTLAKRLLELQTENIVEVTCPGDARCKNYRLTKKGVKIDGVLKQLS